MTMEFFPQNPLAGDPTPCRMPVPSPHGYRAVDLSVSRFERSEERVWERPVLTGIIAAARAAAQGAVLWGGYGEVRRLYAGAALFDQPDRVRDQHLGIDFWADAGTPVYAVADAVLHSQQDNAHPRDYGPTILLRHAGDGLHSLYGHLSRASLALHAVGAAIPAGTLIGWLGAPEENVDWPPHLHFQLIRDLQGLQGDYPGVCARADLAFYLGNCPDPAPYLGL
jgi:peptidoglycan LD-endopeptidase LytH